MQNANDLGRSSTVLEQNSTLIAVIEMSLSTWLVAGSVPGLDRHPLKKLAADEDALLRLLHRWRDEAAEFGHAITRIAVAFEAGRDGFWLARWLRARGVEPFVIHATSVAVPREHRRAKTDRLDTGHLKRALLGWLRGEPDHCQMAAIPSLGEEDARHPNRERENLVSQQTSIVNRMKACLIRLGIRNFKPTLRHASERLGTLRTPEGMPLPPNTVAEMRRDMVRLRLVREQIREIEAARSQRLQVSESGARWSNCWHGSSALESKQRTCLCMRSSPGNCAIAERSRVTQALRALPMRAASEDAKRALHALAMPGCGVGCFNWPGAFSFSRRTAHWPNDSVRERPTHAAARARP